MQALSSSVALLAPAPTARPATRQLTVTCAQRAGTQRSGTQKVQRSAAPAPKRSAGTQRVGTQRTAGRPQPAKQPARPAAKPAPKPRKERDSSAADQSYFNITGYPFPLGPITRRATIRKDLVRGTIWGFEQPQSLGGSNVTTNVRMTIVRLQSGGLWVHAPIAPTRECVRMVKQLEQETGEKVKYIVLPTFGYEHKIFVGPFSRRFPKAEVWVAPSQWSWPINLPVQFFGIFPNGVLRSDATDTPWAEEIEQKVFESSVGIGPYIECAFFHKKTRTLLVTDAVISVPNTPPELVPPENLLDAAARNFFINVLSGDLAAQPVDGVPLKPTELTPAARNLGWRRMALQILYIVPGDLRDPKKGFLAIANRLIVGPILKTLVFSTTPEVTRAWVDSICADWAFTSIIPAHFTAPIPATPSDFRAAFSFVYEPQLSAERAAAASNGSAPAAASASAAKDVGRDESANPAKVLDGFLLGLLGGLRGSGGSARSAQQPTEVRGGVSYPADDIAALDAAKRFLVKAGVVNK
ncbi:lysine--trna ligase [Chlorella sorokiniana]|uniref:Lysine--trna ligase n=1 Tax=Chlorella sorokiniana TaxID=3076 RepID=A0A2P6TBT4_CHLSO|nr:lysine--trna ligase [Chlorella sorokiniana]|eukprot:PRW18341.1 lysine--trna ligase [Chlorella sorokiniana]